MFSGQSFDQSDHFIYTAASVVITYPDKHCTRNTVSDFMMFILKKSILKFFGELLAYMMSQVTGQKAYEKRVF